MPRKSSRPLPVKVPSEVRKLDQALADMDSARRRLKALRTAVQDAANVRAALRRAVEAEDAQEAEIPPED